MRFSTGIEGTFAPDSGKDTLAVTGHYRSGRWREDLELVAELGLDGLRYPIPWHRIERRRGEYDWTHLDALVPYATELGLSIVADPLHHTSYPRWLEGGFADPELVPAYVAFVTQLARRYPRIRTWTPFNEPTCTLDLCGYRGRWHPRHEGDPTYVHMLEQTARATAEAVRALRREDPDVTVLHVDTFERHAALDEASAARADFLNERRFLFEELITGRVTAGHPLHAYLREHGFSEEALARHADDPVRIDERGGNYYPLNEEQLERGETRHAPSRRPAGLAAIVAEYAARLPYPLSLTETNIQGTVRDRISWLKHVLEQVERLARDGVRLRSFSWYPLFDCAGWGCLLQPRRWMRDPQGLVTCAGDWRRERNELSDAYARVAAGAPSAELPGYRFSARHARTIGPLEAHMDWDWRDP